MISGNHAWQSSGNAVAAWCEGGAIEREWVSMLDAKAEMEALWAAVFGQPPAIDADPALLAQLILRCSGPPPVYEAFAPPGMSTAAPIAAPER